MSGVMNKERGKEKETFPPSPPYREKEIQKEISAFPSPSLRAREGAYREGEGEVDFCKSISFSLDAPEVDEEIRNSMLDSVVLAMGVLRLPRFVAYKGRGYNNPKILRKILKQIGDEVFREVLILQLHENNSDGEPRSRAATFMAKLNAIRDDILKGGAA